MKKNANKMIITLTVIMISFFVNVAIYKAYSTCNIGSDYDQIAGYGYAYTTIDNNGRSGVSSGQIITCKSGGEGCNSLTNGWTNWSSKDRNFYVEYDSGPNSKITEVEYTFYYEPEGKEETVACVGKPAVDISNNNGVVRIQFSIKHGSVSRIEATGKYTDSAGNSQSFYKKSFNVKHKMGNTGTVENSETSTPSSKPPASSGSNYGEHGNVNTGTSADNGAAAGTKKGNNTKGNILSTDSSGNIIFNRVISCTEVKELIDNYWKYVMIAVPILLIVTMALDFFKALSKGDSDSLKKSSSNALKRAIAAIILLALPALLSLILGWLGLPLCI